MTTETIQMLLNLIVKETEILYKMNPDREIEICRVLNNCFDNLGQIYASNIQSGFPEKKCEDESESEDGENIFCKVCSKLKYQYDILQSKSSWIKKWEAEGVVCCKCE